MPTVAPTDAGFFEVGGTLSRDALCYVIRPADEELYLAVRRGEFCYLLTSRQMGKSSLMIRTTNRLREEGIAVVILDLTRIGTHNVTVEQWYIGMLAEIGRSLNIRKEILAYWKEHSAFSSSQRFFAALQDIVLSRVPGQIVLFVDEVDTVRSLSFSADEFFAGIRECYTRRSEEPDLCRLVFGLFGVASPSDLIQDPRVTPFNIGTRIELTDFTLERSICLADALGPNGRKKLERVFYWTGGHPYLTLRLCRSLAEAPTMDSSRQVDKLADRLFFCAHGQETDDNLVFVRRWLLESGADPAGVLDLYRQVRERKPVIDDETRPLVEILHLSGIVSSGQRLLRVRNRLYERVFNAPWIRDHMPDAELRRQKAAFRRGVIRTTYLAGGITLAMGVLALYAFVQTMRVNYLEKLALDTKVLTSQQSEMVAIANEQKAVKLARQLTEMAHQLARSRKNIAEVSRLRKQVETLSNARPSPPPLPPNSLPGAIASPYVPIVDTTAPSASTAAHNPAAPSQPIPPTDTPTLVSSPAASTNEPKQDTLIASTTESLATPEPVVPPAVPVQVDTKIDRDPTVTHQPEYHPPPTRRGAFVGKVRFKVTVNADGTHHERLQKGSGRPALDLYLRTYMAHFEWQPAMQNGKPVQRNVDYTLTIYKKSNP